MYLSGDSTLILTPNNVKILIDGGEEDLNILVPYLLDRKIKTIDYIFISHFDSDHCGGIFNVIDELKVKNIIIPKQIEVSDNYKIFIQKIKNKNVNIKEVIAENKIYINKQIYIEVLWPKKIKYKKTN